MSMFNKQLRGYLDFWIDSTVKKGEKVVKYFQKITHVDWIFFNSHVLPSLKAICTYDHEY